MARDLRMQGRPPQAASEGASSGSQTILETGQAELPSATLRLRGARQNDQRRIQWAEDVVDNEGMGKKSSKVCCIYHKPHEPGESDSDSSSSSDSDDEPDLSRAQKSGGGEKPDRKQKNRAKGSERKPSPNAYERQPKHTNKSGQHG